MKAFPGDFEGNKLIALEIEWNNKDPFFDRDLENFKAVLRRPPFLRLKGPTGQHCSETRQI